ncbi:MAG: hypothetical protein ABSB13_05720 [Candidatus Binatus sp.]|jgi:hypothetical protein|uniref:hypothetical protein n=1 Tax=Candidatus Binatus sp. TaxID=2811406 RepID=UPI003D0A0CD5
MIATALVETVMMMVGLVFGCAAVEIHFDEQEHRLKEEHHLKARLHDWYKQRGAGRPHLARSRESAHREPRGHGHVAGLYRFR